MVDWKACGKAIKSLSFPKHRRVVKHATGHFGHSSKLFQWKNQDHEECPLCKERETPEHILRCKDRRARQVWDEAITKLDDWMSKTRTNPEMQEAIIRTLRLWHRGKPIPRAPWLCEFRQALQSQHSIGWYPFLMGHVSIHWQSAQQSYYTWLGHRNTGKKWVTSLILQLYNISWDMWEHRNNIKHNTLNPAKFRKIRALDTSIRQEYTKGQDNLLSRDQRWFKHTAQTIIDQYTPTEKSQWLTSIRNARWRWLQRQESHRLTQDASRQLLRNWLIPLQSKPPTQVNPPA